MNDKVEPELPTITKNDDQSVKASSKVASSVKGSVKSSVQGSQKSSVKGYKK